MGERGFESRMALLETGAQSSNSDFRPLGIVRNYRLSQQKFKLIENLELYVSYVSLMILVKLMFQTDCFICFIFNLF